jgi:tryptophan-rich sensory protein
MNFQEGAFWFLLVIVSMLVGALPRKQRSYYKSLKKPKWFPRPITFGVVWTILYALMATAAVIYQSDLPADHWRNGQTALVVFWIISTMFSPVFFMLKSLPLALLVTVSSFATGIWVDVEFFQRSTLAGALFVPTVAWTFFASILSVVIWYMNTNNKKSTGV